MIITFRCPHCGKDISHMSAKDKIRVEDTRTVFGEVNIFRCPTCGAEFSDIEIDIDIKS